MNRHLTLNWLAQLLQFAYYGAIALIPEKISIRVTGDV
jgi:hypothetical protein